MNKSLALVELLIFKYLTFGSIILYVRIFFNCDKKIFQRFIVLESYMEKTKAPNFCEHICFEYNGSIESHDIPYYLQSDEKYVKYIVNDIPKDAYKVVVQTIPHGAEIDSKENTEKRGSHSLGGEGKNSVSPIKGKFYGFYGKGNVNQSEFSYKVNPPGETVFMKVSGGSNGVWGWGKSSIEIRIITQKTSSGKEEEKASKGVLYNHDNLFLDSSEKSSVLTEYLGRIDTFLPKASKGFVIRKKEYLDLRQIIEGESSITCIWGLPGVGKTGFTVNAINESKDLFSEIFFCNAKDQDTLFSSFKDIAVRLSIPILEKDTFACLQERIQSHLRKKQFEKPYLLILDGLDPSLFNEIMPLRNGHVLISTYEKLEDPDISFIPIKDLSDEEALEMIREIRREKAHEKVDSEDSLKDLAKMFRNYPLALKLATNFINTTNNDTVKSYIEKYGDDFYQAPLTKEEAFNEYVLVKTWQITLKKLRIKYPKAWNCLKVLINFNQEHIPFNWMDQLFINDLSPTRERDQTFSILTDFAVLEKGGRLHGLLSQTIQNSLVDEEKINSFRAAVQILENQLKRIDREVPATYPLVYEVVLQLHLLESKYIDLLSLEERISLYSLASQSLRIVGGKTSFERSLLYEIKALALKKKLLGENHQDVAISLNNVGIFLKNLGRNKEALDSFEKALKLLEKLPAEHQLAVPAILNNIGTSLIYDGRNEEDLDSFEQALKLFEKLPGEQQLVVATILDNIGDSLRNLWRNKEALKYFERAYELRKKFLKENHPEFATSLSHVGVTQRNLKMPEEALKYLKKALKLRKELFGEKHPIFATSLNNVGLTLSDLKMYIKALKYLKKALKLRIELFGEKHSDVATSLNNIGGCLREYGRHEESRNFIQAQKLYEESLDNFTRALKLYEEVHGEKHPDVATSLNNIGSCLRDLKRYGEALDFFEKSLKLRKELFGEEHPAVANSLKNIRNCQRDLGR